MELYQELFRIAEGLNKKDAEIVRLAAVQLAPKPKPDFEQAVRGPGFVHVVQAYWR